jgi:signal transduction histidine kinase
MILFSKAIPLFFLANDITTKFEAEESLLKNQRNFRDLAAHILKLSRENERIHIAREIHDELGQ